MLSRLDAGIMRLEEFLITLDQHAIPHKNGDHTKKDVGCFHAL
jgi:hypothetical protein